MDIPFNVYCPAWNMCLPVLAYRIEAPDIFVTLDVSEGAIQSEYVLCRFFHKIYEHAFYPVRKTFKPSIIKSREDLKEWLYNQEDINHSDNFEAWLNKAQP